MTPLWLARHARPLAAAGLCYGALDLRADTEATRLAAQGLAHAIPQRLAVHFSPLQRCEQLAQALRALRPDFIFKPDARLREMDFGDWEGRSWQAIGAEALAAWTDDFAEHRVGGGENVTGFMRRVAEAWDELATAPTLWITHAGVIRAAGLIARGQRHVERADQWPAWAPAYGEWTRIERPSGAVPISSGPAIRA
ncbi:phosphoglycerate kinase [Rhodoferax koreense]|uniref:Phosphoglycerate kinase n=1 Tax=Rhodoferax koreensis TaxID=1842727 RepID=A0A1P8JSU0_9BURK|nr:histidine phosphatase family protein [Rhodoferax koreense]APW36816.1 phosphoglycerate kinase [Rhodoferax koreense]